MLKLVLLGLVASVLISSVQSTCLVCPEPLIDDTQKKFCATNSYGQASITQSQLASWNCNHPMNLYTKVSDKKCTKVANTCAKSKTCGNDGPTVCGRLNGKGIAYSTAVFANRCQFDIYNCNHQARAYIIASGLNTKCESISP